MCCAAPHCAVHCSALCGALHHTVCGAQGRGTAHHHARLQRVEGLGLHPCASCTSAQGGEYGGFGVGATNPRPVTSQGVRGGAALAAPRPQRTYRSLCCPYGAAAATSQPLPGQPPPRYQSRGYRGAAIAAPRLQPMFCLCRCRCIAALQHQHTLAPVPPRAHGVAAIAPLRRSSRIAAATARALPLLWHCPGAAAWCLAGTVRHGGGGGGGARGIWG